MTYPPGYPQQPSYGRPGYGYPAAYSSSPSGATAIIAGFFGLILTADFTYLLIDALIKLSDLPKSAKVPSEMVTQLVLFGVVALFTLFGALLAFFRVTAGAVLLIIGGVASVATVMLYPALLLRGQYGDFFKLIFKFKDFTSVCMVGGLLFGILVLILAAVPPTFRYLGTRSYRPPQPRW